MYQGSVCQSSLSVVGICQILRNLTFIFLPVFACMSLCLSVFLELCTCFPYLSVNMRVFAAPRPIMYRSGLYNENFRIE